VKNGSLNCYSNHAPRIGWVEDYFRYKDDFRDKNSLGSNMYSFFKRFLRDAGLMDRNSFSRTAQIIDKIGWKSAPAWGIMLVNLSYTPQVGWYIRHVPQDGEITREQIGAMLDAEGVRPGGKASILNAYKRLLALPFGTELGLGKVTVRGKGRGYSIRRGKWEDPDPRVILYSLYRFAAACGGYYQFTLTRLMDASQTGSAGLSPAQIFGLDRSATERLIKGLAVAYPGYVSTAFTLGLDTVGLDMEKTPDDVLGLFAG
jgi:phosphoadenosine phosphosulfate reductase